jgi:site-specific recombinase XerD
MKDYLEWIKDQIKKSKIITEKNKKDIFEYILELSNNGRSKSIQYTYLSNLRNLSIFFRKDFKKITKQDMLRYIEHLKNKHKPSTLNLYKATYKKFYKWLYGNRDYPKQVDWLTIKLYYNDKTSKDVLDLNDIQKLVKATNDLKIKCLIQMLFETACRVSELLNLKKNDIVFYDNYALIKVDGKTGIREIPIVLSFDGLKDWFGNHPIDDDKAYLFNSRNTNSPLTAQGTGVILSRLKKRTEITKPCNPHNFRHSRLTFMNENGFSETELKLFAGWSRDSRMPSIYLHPDSNKVIEKYVKLFGKGIGKKKEIEKKMSNPEIVKAIVDILEKKGII